MFLKSSFVPEILCSLTLLVCATYISGQHFLRPDQQYKYDQIFLSMKRVRGDKQHYIENYTHGGMFFKNKQLYSRNTLFLDTFGICYIHFWTAFFETCTAKSITPINFVNEESFRQKTALFWELHAWGDVFQK